MEQQTPSPPPPNQEWSRAKAITPHFPILDFGERGGINFPFILSKIVASALYNIVWYLILARNITDTFRLFLQHLQSRGAQYSNASGQFVLNVAVWYTFFAGFLMKAENWQSTISYNNFQLIKIMQNCNIAEYQEPCIGLLFYHHLLRILEKMVVITSLPIHELNQINFPWGTCREPTHKCT